MNNDWTYKGKFNPEAKCPKCDKPFDVYIAEAFTNEGASLIIIHNQNELNQRQCKAEISLYDHTVFERNAKTKPATLDRVSQ